MATTRKMARQLINLAAFNETELKDIQDQLESRLKQIADQKAEEAKKKSAAEKLARITTANQDLAIIKNKLADLFWDIEVVVCKLPISDNVSFKMCPGINTELSYHPVSGWKAVNLV